MEEMQSETGPAESGPLNSTWWPSDFIENFGSVSLGSEEDTLDNKESSRDTEQHGLSSQTASQILWSTGVLSGPIPNGFYSVIPERGLKELHDHIPALDELNALGAEGLRADIILVDTEKDKKLTMLKQLIMALVRSSSTSAMIKKIVGLVSDFYKRANLEVSPAKAALEESSHLTENRIQMLGQIKHGSCRPRAILFKVLADTVGLESRLVVGLPGDGTVECTDSYKHLSVIVVVNSVELLVDLTQFPGQLIPRTTKAIFMTHVSAVGEIDSADKDSCDSPLEPNNPLNGFLERADPDSADRHEGLQYQQKLEASLNISGPELQNIIIRPGSLEQKQSLSHSEPNITISFGQRSPWKVIDEQQTANSRPDGASTLEARRLRRRSMGITPEISDDIARAVRARNESLKQDRILNEQGDDGISYPTRDSNNISVSLNNASYLHRDPHEELSGTWSSLCTPSYQISPQKAISFPFPRDFRTENSKRSETSDSVAKEELVSTWNKVLESLIYNNRPLLPFQEWNIDFSELTVGTRVGIGFSGEVFRGFWNGTEVAIKVFLEQDLTAENMEDFCNEISILSRLRHPNVILFLGACTKPPGLSMVTEYMEMGSLYYLIHLSGQKKKLSWRRRLKMLHDICRGLMCIHRMKIVHRDLKTANCLVNKHWTVKICDFGLSRMMADVSTRDSSSAGTPEWMAPELIRNEAFTEKCDIFSFGVIMWELCTLHRPWAGRPPERVVYAVAHEGSRLELPEGPLSRLIADCWALPKERPSCEEILLRLPDCGFTPC